ncbi:carbon-nitrogen hydrolase family protein [Domibacillus antri]|uniref:Carbon-nitrogen hydrolase family protein n=1 Tax=Domibacillus antri TaxID=1714264 RepID=A0A1Q8Q8A5_9BACI|nr:carbon-nitrogen hydrolase family protein [Domibacillus antri]OLN23563.1 carbon-nitrogen hydrolase family protein [Domibacillus antri]
MGTPDTLKAAAIQMSCILGNKEANLQKAESLILKAVKKGAKLVVVPELFSTGYRVEEQDVALAEVIPDETADWFCRIAREHQIYLIGAILEKSVVNGNIYDTAVAAGPEGLIGSYRKIHLWDAENTRFTKGEDYPVFDLGFARLGMQICYEVGFPEGARILAMQGADIVVYPSAFGKARLYAWDIATRARALENGLYVIASNLTGTEKEETTFGGTSRIINPMGTVLAEAGQDEEVIVSEIDLSFVTKQRRTIPYLRDWNKSAIIKGFLE